MSPSDLFNTAGGMRYHWRALRHSSGLWDPYRWALGEWLLGWRPVASTLVVVGPSAGYCLQPFLFERVERVVCLEPDPVARRLFARKLRRAPLEPRPILEFITEDHFVRYPERLPRLLERLGDAAILFSNVIGQLRGLLEIDATNRPELARVRASVAESISGRSWASFHDRVSGRLRPTFEQPLRCATRMTDTEIIDVLFEEATSGRNQRALELLDHLTEGFFPEELPHHYFCWELEPNRFHVVEGVAHSEQPASRDSRP